VEVMPVTLDYFKSMILDLCRQILRARKFLVDEMDKGA
jgi:hypothetical protein